MSERTVLKADVRAALYEALRRLEKDYNWSPDDLEVVYEFGNYVAAMLELDSDDDMWSDVPKVEQADRFRNVWFSNVPSVEDMMSEEDKEKSREALQRIADSHKVQLSDGFRDTRFRMPDMPGEKEIETLKQADGTVTIQELSAMGERNNRAARDGII